MTSRKLEVWRISENRLIEKLPDGSTAVFDTLTKTVHSGPFHFFEAVYSIDRERQPQRWRVMDLDAKVRFFRRIETPSMPEIGRVLAHRSIVEEANRQGLKNVLVFEEGFVEEVPPFPQRGLAGPPPASRDGLQSSPF